MIRALSVVGRSFTEAAAIKRLQNGTVNVYLIRQTIEIIRAICITIM